MIRGVAFIKLVQHVAMVFHYSQNPQLFLNRQWRSQLTAKQAKFEFIDCASPVLAVPSSYVVTRPVNDTLVVVVAVAHIQSNAS